MKETPPGILPDAEASVRHVRADAGERRSAAPDSAPSPNASNDNHVTGDRGGERIDEGDDRTNEVDERIAEVVDRIAELDERNDDRPWERMSQLLANDEVDAVALLLDEMPPSEGTRALLRLDEDERTQILSEAPLQVAADLIDELPTGLAASFVDNLSTDRAADIIGQLESDTQADLIGEVHRAEAILAEMQPEAAAEVRRLAAYDPDCAGGLMVAESLTFSQNDTVGKVLARLAEGDEFLGQSPYMLDDAGRVVGYAALSRLLSASRYTPLHQVMSPAMTAPVDMELAELRDLFDKYDFLSIPVCDEEGSMLGIVHAMRSIPP